MSQLKWVWFCRRERLMKDIATFDEASRGPWGSLLLKQGFLGWGHECRREVSSLWGTGCGADAEQISNDTDASEKPDGVLPSVDAVAMFKINGINFLSSTKQLLIQLRLCRVFGTRKTQWKMHQRSTPKSLLLIFSSSSSMILPINLPTGKIYNLKLPLNSLLWIRG